jgi:hypothetical protein
VWVWGINKTRGWYGDFDMYEKYTIEHIQGRRGPWGVHWHTP